MFKLYTVYRTSICNILGNHYLSPSYFLFTIFYSLINPLSHLFPVKAELREPVESVHITAARFDQFINDIPGMDFYGNQGHNLKTHDFGEISSNGVRVAAQHGHLQETHDKTRHLSCSVTLHWVTPMLC